MAKDTEISKALSQKWLSNKIDNAVATIGEFKTERYTREDARRDRGAGGFRPSDL